MGGAVQQFKTGGVCTQLEVLPVWLHRRLFYSTLSVSEADDLHVDQIATARKASVLRHEMTFGNVEHLSVCEEESEFRQWRIWKYMKRGTKFCSHSIIYSVYCM